MTVRTMDQLTEAGVTFDTAIPVEWFKRACDITGVNVSGHIVVVYPDGAVWGVFTAVTAEGEGYLEAILT